jgi:hypothetical protein
MVATGQKTDEKMRLFKISGFLPYVYEKQKEIQGPDPRILKLRKIRALVDPRLLPTANSTSGHKSRLLPLQCLLSYQPGASHTVGKARVSLLLTSDISVLFHEHT